MPFQPQSSANHARSGSHSIHYQFLNFNGIAQTGLSRHLTGIQPGATYEMRAWVKHRNTQASTYFYVLVEPGNLVANGPFRTDSRGLGDLPPGQWRETVLTFTPVTSYVTLRVVPGGLVSQNSGEQVGKDDIWVDDITLTRLS
jgi:hypothetical protein